MASMMLVHPDSRGSGARGRAVASATAFTVCSSVRRAMPRSPYLASMASPCSVMRQRPRIEPRGDRKSTRLNSSHMSISYAVFCLKKKKKRKGVWDTEEKEEKRKGKGE